MDFLPPELSPGDYEFALVASVLIALISFYCFFRNWKRLRIIEDTPTARLRSAHQGYIELEGKGQLTDEQLIYTPLSNHSCLWYRSQIEQREIFTENGRTQTRWHVIYKKVSNDQFKLIDGASACYVDPDGAEIKGGEKLVWYGNTEWPIRTQLLESQSSIHAMTSRYRYSEWLILPGQPLYILGQFRTSSATTQHSMRTVMIDLLRDWKRDQPSLRKRFDANQDGNIDQTEWEVARQEAQLAARKVHDELALEPDIHIIAKPKNSAQPFIISVYSQAMLVKNFRRNIFIALAICILSAGYCIRLIHMHV
jgi:hypothetical protein